jgi:hypothetical protein
MSVHVFVTEDGTANGTGPLLFLPDRPDAYLPAHPRSLSWRYFATVSSEDNLVAGEGRDAALALSQDGFYVANRLI